MKKIFIFLILCAVFCSAVSCGASELHIDSTDTSSSLSNSASSHKDSSPSGNTSSPESAIPSNGSKESSEELSLETSGTSSSPLTDTSLETLDSTKEENSQISPPGSEVSESENSVVPSSPDSSKESSSPPSLPDAWMLSENREMPETDYLKQVTFLGDSTTYGMIGMNVLPDGNQRHQVWYGPKGTLSLLYATDHLINDGSERGGLPLNQLAAEIKPKILVITLGVGVSYSVTKNQFDSCYRLVVDSILTASPDTTIIFNTIYPVCEKRFAEYEKINNADIEKVNGWLYELAGAYHTAGKNVYYLDSYSCLLGEDGYLPVSYSVGDGLHLSEAGYKIILSNLCKHQIPND